MEQNRGMGRGNSANDYNEDRRYRNEGSQQGYGGSRGGWDEDDNQRRSSQHDYDEDDDRNFSNRYSNEDDEDFDDQLDAQSDLHEIQAGDDVDETNPDDDDHLPDDDL